ncbi:hypothetical protein L596_009228 [Steinernema carpocapsae]|uniref:Homeobox domain-containing protein n=1 Tax=Steinernema carpocapsae TaxID=34508 RepID=A0A4U5PFA2_STECR|nr:hypothetical protein L596_009228 [Steinernema carpocapsae]
MKCSSTKLSKLVPRSVETRPKSPIQQKGRKLPVDFSLMEGAHNYDRKRHEILLNEFSRDSEPSDRHLMKIALKLEMEVDRVESWFNNRRAKEAAKDFKRKRGESHCFRTPKKSKIY